MGDLIDLQARIARLLLEEQTSDHDTQLLNEGLDLLADYRSIHDSKVRESIRTMVANLAAALRRA